MRCSRFARGIPLRLVVLSGLLALPGMLVAQGPYKAVTAEDVVKLEFAYYYTPDKAYREVDFEWTFTETGFVLKAGKGSIPADLRNRLLPPDTDAEEIRGHWKIDDREGTRLVLTNIKAGDQPGNQDVALPIYRTAPTIVRIGLPQYVFRVKNPLR